MWRREEEERDLSLHYTEVELSDTLGAPVPRSWREGGREEARDGVVIETKVKTSVWGWGGECVENWISRAQGEEF